VAVCARNPDEPETRARAQVTTATRLMRFIDDRKGGRPTLCAKTQTRQHEIRAGASGPSLVLLSTCSGSPCTGLPAARRCTTPGRA
jgi:hypothetical protein